MRQFPARARDNERKRLKRRKDNPINGQTIKIINKKKKSLVTDSINKTRIEFDDEIV